MLPENVVYAVSLVVRVLSALLNPISDCDESYNYWEPTSFLMTGVGFQTWEYSPEFAVRSYAYILPHALLGKAFLLAGLSPIHTFYAIRIVLSILCWACESFLVRSLHPWFGRS